MDALKKSSFTLLEMVITMVLSGILILALTSQFIAMVRFKTALENKAEPSREAYIVMAHMTRVLRFAKTTPAITFPGAVTTEERLTATIEGGHIALVPETSPDNTTICYYRRDKATNSLYFQAGTGAEQELSKYVTYFNASVADKDLTLKLIFSKGDTVTPVQTKIRILGE